MLVEKLEMMEASNRISREQVRPGLGTRYSCCLCSHHSAGVGRTGVFITLSIVLERMRYEGVVDIFQTVKMLRTQRPAMVQTEVRKKLGVAF
jgi:protein tyrosine phosphatase